MFHHVSRGSSGHAWGYQSRIASGVIQRGWEIPQKCRFLAGKIIYKSWIFQQTLFDHSGICRVNGGFQGDTQWNEWCEWERAQSVALLKLLVPLCLKKLLHVRSWQNTMASSWTIPSHLWLTFMWIHGTKFEAAFMSASECIRPLMRMFAFLPTDTSVCFSSFELLPTPVKLSRAKSRPYSKHLGPCSTSNGIYIESKSLVPIPFEIPGLVNVYS